MLVSIGGTRLNVLEQGAGPTVVFLHGLGGDASNWQPQLDALEDSYRVVAVDTRGFGRSDRTYGAVTFADYADDVRRLIDALDLGRPVVVGVSMGGMVAQALAAAHPHVVRGLVLASTSCQSDPAMGEQTVGAGQAAAEHGMGAIIDAFLPACFAPATVAAGAPCVAAFGRSFSSTDPLSFLLGTKAVAGLDLRAQIGSVDVPTLVIHAEHDLLIPREHSEAIHDAIPGSKLVQLPNAGHVVNMEQPDAFNELLRDFLAEHAA